MRCFIAITPKPKADGLIYAHLSDASTGLIPMPTFKRNVVLYALDAFICLPTLHKRLREFCSQEQYKIFTPPNCEQQQQADGTEWIDDNTNWLMHKTEEWLKKRDLLLATKDFAPSKKVAAATSKTRPMRRTLGRESARRALHL